MLLHISETDYAIKYYTQVNQGIEMTEKLREQRQTGSNALMIAILGQNAKITAANWKNPAH